MKGLKTSQGICLVSVAEIAPQQFASTSTTSGLTLRKAPSMSATSIAARRTNTSIVLLTTRTDASRDELMKHFQASKISELALPKRFLVVQAVPTLGTGKTDYQRAKTLALAAVEPEVPGGTETALQAPIEEAS